MKFLNNLISLLSLHIPSHTHTIRRSVLSKTWFDVISRKSKKRIDICASLFFSTKRRFLSCHEQSYWKFLFIFMYIALLASSYSLNGNFLASLNLNYKTTRFLYKNTKTSLSIWFGSHDFNENIYNVKSDIYLKNTRQNHFNQKLTLCM